MPYEEKLNIVLHYLLEQRELTVKGKDTEILFDYNTFSELNLIESSKIIQKLQDDEQAIKIKYAIDSNQRDYTYIPGESEKPIIIRDHNSVSSLKIVLNETFDKWYESYLLQKKQKVENLSDITLIKIYDVAKDIDEALESSQSNVIKIPIFQQRVKFQILLPINSIGAREAYETGREESVQYLINKGILNSASIIPNVFGDAITYMSIDVMISKFSKFYKELCKEMEKRNKKIAKDEVKTIITKTNALETTPNATVNMVDKSNEQEYFIEYKNRIILLNGKIELGKPQFNRESEKLFDFLYKNPNIKHPISELENKLAIKLGDTTPKRIERLGFVKGLRQIFFNIGKNTIEFKNPAKP